MNFFNNAREGTSMIRLIALAAAMAVAFQAQATNKSEPVKPSPSAAAVGVGLGVGIAEGGKSNADASAGAIGTGGNAVASGGEGGDGGSAIARGEGGTGGHAESSQTQSSESHSTGGTAQQSQSATNAGNAQSVQYNQPRQVPPVFLGSLMVSECGAGANAGGAGSGGAGALGVVWTTKRCYALRSAINYFAIGEYETGCELLNYVNREALKLIGKKPDCASIAQRLVAESESEQPAQSIDLSNYPTKREVSEQIDRAFKKSHYK